MIIYKKNRFFCEFIIIIFKENQKIKGTSIIPTYSKDIDQQFQVFKINVKIKKAVFKFTLYVIFCNQFKYNELIK